MLHHIKFAKNLTRRNRLQDYQEAHRKGLCNMPAYDKTELEKLYFGNFRPMKTIPKFIFLGTNRNSSIEFHQSIKPKLVFGFRVPKFMRDRNVAPNQAGLRMERQGE